MLNTGLLIGAWLLFVSRSLYCSNWQNATDMYTLYSHLSRHLQVVTCNVECNNTVILETFVYCWYYRDVCDLWDLQWFKCIV